MRTLLVVATLSTPFALGLFAALPLSAGCTGSKPAANPAASTSASTSASEAGAAMTTPPDAALPDAATLALDAGDGNPWAPVLASASASGDAAAPACWKGFTPTGVPEADVADLGNRCAVSQGMTPLIPPVKHTFKQGESKSIPVAIVPGCYRIIAVGGKGVKDVDLALKDNAGKIVAADLTPDDIFPMIHPNKEFCADSVQFLNLTISVKKGAGEVAGGVWKR
ncbi:MAG: hypothetical protein ACXVEF_22500 [Polyangiales bacterium]